MKINLPATMYLFDEKISKHPYYPFAYTDTLTKYVSETQLPILHFWQLEKTVILGMKDTRITNLPAGLKKIHQYGYQPIVRNSGGLAVVADEGILNTSLIIPNTKKISINDAYQIMHGLIAESFNDFPVSIKAIEIKESYCPGEYDLSIHGKKFAGIAQRRLKNGIAIMIYLSISGDQGTRGKMIQEFYQSASNAPVVQEGYPEILPESMANLSDLLQTSLTVELMKKRLKNTLQHQWAIDIVKEPLMDYFSTDRFHNEFTQQLTKMEKRNEIIHSL